MRPVYINLYGNEAIVRAEGMQTNVDALVFVLNLQRLLAFQYFLKWDSAEASDIEFLENFEEKFLDVTARGLLRLCPLVRSTTITYKTN